MILVFLFLGLILIVLSNFFILLLSSIKFKITKLYISNVSKKFNIFFTGKIGIFLFNNIKLFEIKIDDKKIKNLYKSGKINFKKIRSNKNLSKDFLNYIKNNLIKLEKFNLNGDFGLKDAAYTAYLYLFISSIISIIISRKIYKFNIKKYNYNLKPVFLNQNIVNLEFNCIISIKIVHIINIVLRNFKKERVNKYERTSNRGNYAYSNE